MVTNKDALNSVTNKDVWPWGLLFAFKMGCGWTQPISKPTIDLAWAKNY